MLTIQLSVLTLKSTLELNKLNASNNLWRGRDHSGRSFKIWWHSGYGRRNSNLISLSAKNSVVRLAWNWWQNVFKALIYLHVSSHVYLHAYLSVWPQPFYFWHHPQGLSTVSGVTSAEDRPNTLGQSQSVMNIPRMSPKAEAKKRRAPALPGAPTPTLGHTSFESYQVRG